MDKWIIGKDSNNFLFSVFIGDDSSDIFEMTIGIVKKKDDFFFVFFVFFIVFFVFVVFVDFVDFLEFVEFVEFVEFGEFFDFVEFVDVKEVRWNVRRKYKISNF